MQNQVHIISFDIPFPANYGGAIDVFHKIRCLHKNSVKITLHCFQYGDRIPSKDLEALCEKVYYYKRNTSFLNQLSLLPFNVTSRVSSELKQNLLKDDFPILFEVLHTCNLLNDPDLKHRKKIFRHSNIEHDYFNELAKAERSFFKKWYLKLEALKLRWFEKIITNAQAILSVSEKDLEYFKSTYPNTPSYYLPSFHKFDELQCLTGKGDYILYHGNLSISENYMAAEWLIKHVFSKLNHPIIIAGLNPPKHLIELIKTYPHIQLKENCSEKDMQDLITNAHIHCLYTQQATGLKLKLLNVLFSGRFVIANSNMLIGTHLESNVEIANDANTYVSKIKEHFIKEFTSAHIQTRQKELHNVSNQEKTKKLIHFLFDSKDDQIH